MKRIRVLGVALLAVSLTMFGFTDEDDFVVVGSGPEKRMESPVQGGVQQRVPGFTPSESPHVIIRVNEEGLDTSKDKSYDISSWVRRRWRLWSCSDCLAMNCSDTCFNKCRVVGLCCILLLYVGAIIKDGHQHE